MLNNKVSIIVPVYNVELYLEECIDSVINQTYENLEIIIVEDGSTDNSGMICDAYENKDERITVIHKENGGLSSARNAGLDSATGEYIYFLDSDDYIEHNAIELLVNDINNNDSVVSILDGNIFYEKGIETRHTNSYARHNKYETCNGKKLLESLLKVDEYRTAVPFLFFKMSFFEKYKLRFKEGIIHEDELFTALVFLTDAKVSHCYHRLYNYRIRPASIMTASAMSRRFESMLTIYNELAKMYKNKTASGEAATMYLIREAKSVIGKYNLLSEEQKLDYAEKYKKFKKNVMGFKGFGDIKLKIKCSGKIGNIYYRLVNKFFK